MRIVFLDGSEMAEPDLDKQTEKKLRALVRDEEEVTLLYHHDSKWMRLCEWAGRRVEAAYPQKHVELVGVDLHIRPDFMMKELRYTRVLDPADVKADEVERWLIDQADYAIIYMQPLLCMGVRRLRTYHYAQEKLGDRCINLCSAATVQRIWEQAAHLPKWQKTAMEGLLMRTPKKELARQLGVSLTTVHSYQLAAQREVAKAMLGPETTSRRCALFGFGQWRLSSRDASALYQAILYLLRYCHVDSFIVPQESYDSGAESMQLLREACKHWPHEVRIICMKPRDPDSWGCGMPDQGTELTYEQHASAIGPKRLEERHAMIDAADILLCRITQVWRSGLNYARRKRLPIINLAECEADGG